MHASSVHPGIAFYEDGDNAKNFLTAVKGRAPVQQAVDLVRTLPPDALVIDAGCGAGIEAEYLARHGLRVHAYDASWRMVAATRSRLEGVNLLIPGRVEVHCHQHGDLADHLATPASAVLAIASLLFLDDCQLRVALRALCAGLAQGGVLSASFKAAQGERVRAQPDGRVYFDKSVDDLAWIAGLAGMEPVSGAIAADALGRGQPWVTFVLRRS